MRIGDRFGGLDSAAGCDAMAPKISWKLRYKLTDRNLYIAIFKKEISMTHFIAVR
jgi:hypothetical protein